MGEYWVTGGEKNNFLTLQRVPVRTIAVDKVRGRLAACLASSIHVWDIKTGELLRKFADKEIVLEPLEGVAVDKVEGLGDFLKWKGARDTPLRWSDTRKSEWLRSIEFSPNGDWIVACGSHTTYVWNWNNDTPMIIDNANYAAITDSHVAVSSIRASIRLFELPSFQLIAETSSGGSYLQFSDGRLFAATSSGIDCFDAKKLLLIDRFSPIRHSHLPQSFRFVPNQDKLIEVEFREHRGYVTTHQFAR